MNIILKKIQAIVLLQGRIKNYFNSSKTIVVPGKKMANELNENLKKQIIQIRNMKNIKEPTIAIILVGNKSSGLKYVQIKINACKKTGIRTEFYQLTEQIQQDQVEKLLQWINARPDIDAILIQLPLPKNLKMDKLFMLIDDEKDVDCLKFQIYQNNSQTYLFKDQLKVFPCFPLACLQIFNHYNINYKIMRTTIIGKDILGGIPLTQILRQNNRNVENISSTNKDEIEKSVQLSDIVISIANCRHIIRGNWIKQGAIVIDAGANHSLTKTGKIEQVGDVEFEQACKKASIITPVPGGVGPLIVSMFLKNIVTLWNNKYSKISQNQNIIITQ